MIDGGIPAQEDDLWQVIVDSLDAAQGYQEATTEGTNKTIGVDGKAEAGVVLIKATGQFSWDLSTKRENVVSRTKNLSSRVAALQGLKANRIPLVIDDFHYLPTELQTTVVRALKQLIFDGILLPIKAGLEIRE